MKPKLVYDAFFVTVAFLLLRGRNVDTENNFIELLHLHNADAVVDRWLSKKSNKYTAHEIQDTILKEMVHKILHDTGQNICDGGLFSIMEFTIAQTRNSLQSTFYRWIPSYKITLNLLACIL